MSFLNTNKFSVFGSQQGSLLVWKPSKIKQLNIFRRTKLSHSKIEKVHIHKNRVVAVEAGNIHVLTIDEGCNIEPIRTIYSGILFVPFKIMVERQVKCCVQDVSFLKGSP